MLLLYYNPTQEKYYYKFLNGWHNKAVGDTDQFNHVIVKMYYIDDNKRLVSCKSYSDYLEQTIYNDGSKRNRLIDRAICLLDKLKK